MTAFFAGVGGTFLFSPDPGRLAAWYAEHFGFTWETMGETRYQMFMTLDRDDPSKKVDFHFGIMKADVDFPAHPVPEVEPREPSAMYGDQPYMIGVKVNDMDAAVAHLRAKGVEIIRRDDLEYGAFAWVRDCEGRRVELYQPVPGAFDDEDRGH